MKKSILILAMLLGVNIAQGQSCCKMTSGSEFAQLAMNEDFAGAHLEPLPYAGEKELGKVIKFDCKDSLQGSGYFMNSKTPSNKWIFIYHEWWGLNSYIKQEVDKLHKEFPNCNIIAIDLYDGKVATDAGRAQEFSAGLVSERAKNIIEGAFVFAGREARVVSLGWCFGGGWSLQSALIGSDKSIGCVIYYGLPETDDSKIEKLQCDILGFYGKNDKFILPSMIETFGTVLDKAGIPHQFKFYDADHAFANPSNPKHNVEATKDAYALTVEYLKSKFNQQ